MAEKNLLNYLIFGVVLVALIVGAFSVLGHSVYKEVEFTAGFIESCCDLNNTVKLSCESNPSSTNTFIDGDYAGLVSVRNSSNDIISYSELISFYTNNTAPRGTPTNLSGHLDNLDNYSDSDDTTRAKSIESSTAVHESWVISYPVECNTTTCPIELNLLSSGSMNVSCCNDTTCTYLRELKNSVDANDRIDIIGECQNEVSGNTFRVDIIINMTEDDYINNSYMDYQDRLHGSPDFIHACSINSSLDSLNYTFEYKCRFEENSLDGYMGGALIILSIVIIFAFSIYALKSNSVSK